MTSPELEHPLLYPKAPAYTHTTVRRAFIVWLKCGQTNQFRDVCDYYHRLEAMEEKLPAELRASSRNHEFSLFVTQPPTTPYQQHLFPQLYPIHETGHQNIPQYEINLKGAVVEDFKSGNKVDEKRYKVSNEDIFEASQMFKDQKSKNEVKNYNSNVNIVKSVEVIQKPNIEMKVNEGKNTQLAFDLQTTPMKTKSIETVKDNSGTTKQEIVKTSLMIKDYCKEHQIPLKNFLETFKEFADRSELPNTVNNVNFYIKRRMIFEELGLTVKVFRARSSFIEKEKKNICVYRNAGVSKPMTNHVFGIKNTNNTIANDTAAYRAITKDLNTLYIQTKEKCNSNKNVDRHIKSLKVEGNNKVAKIKFSDSHFVNVNVEMFRKI